MQCEKLATQHSIKIRSAVPEDAPAVVAIEKACFADSWTERSIQKALTDERTGVLVAQREGAICGYAAAWTVGDEGEITRLAVIEAARGHGIGEQLLDATLKECVQRGVMRLFLEVRASNTPARRLYERCGFVEAGLRRRYYRDGEDAVIMGWTSGE
jgi:ribosomal-protein-alanine N-acetyltransferase